MMIKSQQENILSLLCFSEKSVGFLSNTVSPGLFDTDIFIHIANVAIDFYREYKKPVANHLMDLLESRLNDPLYRDALENLFGIFEDLNEKFVLKQLSDFLYQQNLKKTVQTIVDCAQNDDYEGIEESLSECKKVQTDVFNSGTLFGGKKTFGFLEQKDTHFLTGIPELDKYGICPAPKELFLLIGKSGIGKTWSLNHLGKYLLLQKKKILHITLEMSEEKVCERYFQSLFSIPKSDINLKTKQIVLEKNRYGTAIDFTQEVLKRKFSFEHKNIKKKLKKLLETTRNLNLIIKQFPTGQLTFNQLVGYLDQLLEFENFQPDVILLDYPDIMRIDRMNMRQAMAGLFVNLRGLAVERNLALITVSQANRAEFSGVLTKDNANEAADKGFTSDVILTLNQTASEKEFGLLRLYVDKGRNSIDGQTILISQNLSNGQFFVDSAALQTAKQEKLYEKLEEL